MVFAGTNPVFRLGKGKQVRPYLHQNLNKKKELITNKMKKTINKTLKTFVSNRLKRPVSLNTRSSKVGMALSILNEYADDNWYKFNHNFPMRILVCVPTLVQVKLWEKILNKAVSNMETPCIIDIETRKSLEGTCRQYHLGICDRIRQSISFEKNAISQYVKCENIVTVS